MPGAISFEVRDGDPRVIVGYAADAPAEDALVGYAFLTSDVPPEELGYNGPIEVLVGMDRDGTLTGVRVTHYVESYIRTRGDFLRTPGYEAQFTGKSISDPFRAKRDVRVVSRATISVSAMSRGIRASARRVYANYLATRPSAESGGSLLTIGMEELEELSWSDMVAGELVHQIHVLENNVTRIVLSFAHIRSDSVGEMLVGRTRFGEVVEQLGERTQEDPLMLVGVDGALALLFYPRTLSLVQGADTIDMDNPDVVMLGEPRSGMVQGQFRNVGVMAVPGSLDVEQAFDIHFDLRPGMGLYTTAYPPPQRAERVVAEDAPAETEPDPGPVAEAVDPAGGAEAAVGGETAGDAETAGGAETVGGGEAAGGAGTEGGDAVGGAETSGVRRPPEARRPPGAEKPSGARKPQGPRRPSDRCRKPWRMSAMRPRASRHRPPPSHREIPRQPAGLRAMRPKALPRRRKRAMPWRRLRGTIPRWRATPLPRKGLPRANPHSPMTPRLRPYLSTGRRQPMRLRAIPRHPRTRPKPRPGRIRPRLASRPPRRTSISPSPRTRPSSSARWRALPPPRSPGCWGCWRWSRWRSS